MLVSECYYYLYATIFWCNIFPNQSLLLDHLFYLTFMGHPQGKISNPSTGIFTISTENQSQTLTCQLVMQLSLTLPVNGLIKSKMSRIRGKTITLQPLGFRLLCRALGKSKRKECKMNWISAGRQSGFCTLVWKNTHHQDWSPKVSLR